MFDLVSVGNAPLTMTSREVAELTGKRHDNVMADIRKMLVEIQSPEKAGDYKDGRGRTQPCLLLTKEESLCLVAGYSIPMRARIVDRWQELESQHGSHIPQTYAAALLEAGRLALEVEQKTHQRATQPPTGHKTMTNLISKAFEGRNIRIITDQQGEPWFVAADIAKVLEYRNAPDMTRNLDDDETGTHILRIRSDNGVEQDREVTIINESGLYSAILRSRKPEAKLFKRWVTFEVLPSIRKHGGYIAGQEQDSPEVIMAKALMVAQSVIDRKSQELAAAQQTIAANAHKSHFFDNYAYCGGSLGFREVAKLLKAKEHEFRSFLCAKRYMYQLSGQWMAYAQHLDAGRFEVKTGAAERNNHAFAKTVFTPKGVQWIAGEWGKHQAEVSRAKRPNGGAGTR